MVECRIIGALEAKQTERDGKEQRNDRLIGISTVSEMYADLHELKDMNKTITDQIAHFLYILQ